MSAFKRGNETKPSEKKRYVPHQLRSRPFRCISLPMCCLVFFVFYWFILVPLVYHGLTVTCNKTCDWSPKWRHIYWAVVSIIFIITLAIILCLWCCKPKKKTTDDEEVQKERDKLLSEPAKYNQLKQKDNFASVSNEKKSVSRETIDNESFNVTSLQNVENTIEKRTVILPTKKFESEKQGKITDDVPIKTSPQDNKPNESIMQEIDEMFPRCSMRRKPGQKKRPDTLIIHSPKYPKEDNDLKRHTITERPKTASPLTPREIFFFDLMQSANRQTINRTQNFLENERKHSSNNFTNLRKPEVKDFILKQRTETEASSPEYFIANVPQRNSCTTEAFMYVDGGQPEETLTICYIDQDDDVFKN